MNSKAPAKIVHFLQERTGVPLAPGTGQSLYQTCSSVRAAGIARWTEFVVNSCPSQSEIAGCRRTAARPTECNDRTLAFDPV